MFYDTLKYFQVVAEELNMTRAAEKLHLTQQALSVYISKLESKYRSVFFERKRTGLVLTPEGRRFYEFAVAARRLEEKTEEDIGRIRGGSAGTLTIGSSMTRAVTLLPKVVSRFALAHPFVKLDFRIVSSIRNELESTLLRRELDIAIAPAVVNMPATVEMIELEQGRLCLSIPKSFIETIYYLSS